jgi:DNA polymerase-3 subunit delta
VSGAAAALHLIADERRGEFDGYRADCALVEIRRGLEAGRGGALAVLTYHAADCDAESLAEAIETPSLFGARTLVIVRGAEALDERAQERLVAALDRQAPQVTVAIVARAPDMRRRLFARCRERGRRVVVDHPRTGEMPTLADELARARGRRLDPEARDVLVECVGRDLLVLASELDKLAVAIPDERAIGAADVRRLTPSAREHSNFEVADAIRARDTQTTLRVLAQSLDDGAQPIALIGAIAAALRVVLAGADLVARGRSTEEAGRAVGVSYYQQRAFEQGVRAFRPAELRRGLLRLAELDLASKTGMGDPRALLESWVLEFCGSRPSRRVAAP